MVGSYQQCRHPQNPCSTLHGQNSCSHSYRPARGRIARHICPHSCLHTTTQAKSNQTSPGPRWTDPEMIRLTLSCTQWQENTGHRQQKWNQSRSSHDNPQQTLIKTPVCLEKKTQYDHKTLKLVCHHQSRLHAERDLPKRSVFLSSPCSVFRRFVSFILYGSWISPVG